VLRDTAYDACRALRVRSDQPGEEEIVQVVHRNGGEVVRGR